MPEKLQTSLPSSAWPREFYPSGGETPAFPSVQVKAGWTIGSLWMTQICVMCLKMEVLNLPRWGKLNIEN